MMNKCILASLIALLALTGWASGQGALGMPVAPASPADAGIVHAGLIVHENGKRIRCRLLETWQLADGRLAQLVESTDSGEKITVVTEPSVQTNARAMPVRIFLWGLGRRMPPEGSPIPPQMWMDPGIVVRNEPPPPPLPTNLLLPSPLADKATRGEIARMVADGSFSPAEITAAKIMLDETQAKARQAAVKYLATVDCHYYPEAEISLIAALRADRSESVRLEAAQALGTCRGVTVRILDALRLAASGQETDGNPAETSEQVRMAASSSLNRLLSAGMSMEMAPPPPSLRDWPAPPPDQPASQVASSPPIPASAIQPMLQQERVVAATVSTPAPTPITITARAPNPRPTVYGLLLNLLHGSDVGSGHKDADPRLRGMAPLGSDAQLAIPSHPRPVAGTPSPYND